MPNCSQYYEVNNAVRCKTSVLFLDTPLIPFCSYYLVLNIQFYDLFSLIKATLQNRGRS